MVEKDFLNISPQISDMHYEGDSLVVTHVVVNYEDNKIKVPFPAIIAFDNDHYEVDYGYWYCGVGSNGDNGTEGKLIQFQIDSHSHVYGVCKVNISKFKKQYRVLGFRYEIGKEEQSLNQVFGYIKDVVMAGKMKKYFDNLKKVN